MKVLVGLSGGVDSAVCALILKNKGYEVVGATMAIWSKDGIAKSHGKKNACFGPSEAEDIESARKIAEEIGIPYYVFDCKNEYQEIVLNNFKSEYLSGRTPNPCIWCNALVKFKVLPELAKKAGVEFDKFATGHYARVIEENGHFYLKRGKDPKKDQSYFLYRLKEEQLKNILLPLGELTKTEVREIAKNAGLEVADKGDSQDFYDGDYNELLEIKEKEGNIVDIEGNILGKHKGIWNFTIGQRKGLKISSKEALYVLRTDKETNEVVVGSLDKTFKNHIYLSDVNIINGNKPFNNINVTAKIRSASPLANAKASFDGKNAEIIFENYQKSVAKGQSAVFYDGETVIGGGIIEKAE